MEEGDSTSYNSKTIYSDRDCSSSQLISSPKFFPGREAPMIPEELLPVCLWESGSQ